MKSNDYEKLATDMSGFNMNFSQNGRYNYGFYASVSDHIASEYNDANGAAIHPARARPPRGRRRHGEPG